jgi:hypothetical protein
MTGRAGAVTPKVLRSLTIDTEPWLSCNECFDRMDEYVEHLLADLGYTEPLMATHLAACAACAEETQSLYALLA